MNPEKVCCCRSHILNRTFSRNTALNDVTCNSLNLIGRSLRLLPSLVINVSFHETGSYHLQTRSQNPGEPISQMELFTKIFNGFIIFTKAPSQMFDMVLSTYLIAYHSHRDQPNKIL